jgi:hypothetical protein
MLQKAPSFEPNSGLFLLKTTIFTIIEHSTKYYSLLGNVSDNYCSLLELAPPTLSGFDLMIPHAMALATVFSRLAKFRPIWSHWYLPMCICVMCRKTFNKSVQWIENLAIYLRRRRLQKTNKFKMNYLKRKAGWPDRANFHPLGDCLLWFVFRKLLK